MPRTLTGARFDMSATLLHQGQQLPTGIDLTQFGQWVNSQDPLTGEIVRIWTPFDDPTPDQNPSTDPGNVAIGSINCLARGVVDGGIRVAGTTEWWGADYKNIEFVQMWVPPKVTITKRDRITNIADKYGHIRWLDEEFANTGGQPPVATVFNVNGVTPLYNAFNRLTEWYVQLERAEVSDE